MREVVRGIFYRVFDELAEAQRYIIRVSQKLL
jgi:hypothetical protein